MTTAAAIEAEIAALLASEAGDVDEEPPAVGKAYYGAKIDRGHYFPADTGCRLHPSCLSCPRALCIHDEYADRDAKRVAGPTRFPSNKPSATARREAVKALALEDKTSTEIAAAVGISQRQVNQCLSYLGMSRPMGWKSGRPRKVAA